MLKIDARDLKMYYYIVIIFSKIFGNVAISVL